MKFLKTPALLCITLAGCASMNFAELEAAQRRLACGMSQEQVEGVIQAPIRKMDVPTKRRTHLYRDGSVDLMLVFDGDRLVRSQIIKTKPLFGLEEVPAVNHCS